MHVRHSCKTVVRVKNTVAPSPEGEARRQCTCICCRDGLQVYQHIVLLAKLNYVVEPKVSVDNTSVMQEKCSLAAADGKCLHILQQTETAGHEVVIGACYDTMLQ